MPKYNGLATNMEAMRIYNFCARTQSSNILGCCLGDVSNSSPIPDPGKMKTVFLLELTGGYVENDIPMKNTLNYYWNTYPQEFIKCPIVDTGGSLDKTLELLKTYYNKGFTRFVGFSRSTIVKGVLPWFNLNSYAVGISATSSDPTLNIPKNIFRMTPTDKFMIESIKTYLEKKTVNYIYSQNENAPRNLIPYINSIPYINLNLVPINSASDFETAEFQNKVNNFSDTEIILFYVLTGREDYLKLYAGPNPALSFKGQQYDILGIVSPVIETSNLINLYNIVTFKGIETSIIWRNGYISLTSDNFSIVTPNILNLLITLYKNELVDNIDSNYGILQFDPVSKDLLYPSFLIETYTGTNTFINTSLYVVGPILGPYNATFTNPSPEISIIPTPSYKPYGKAIALFELSINPNPVDPTFRDSLYYFWYKNSSFPKFPIIDTEGDINKTINLLNLYYSQGYRIFLGFSRSSVVRAVINWFNSHPLAVGISLWSTAISLNNVSRNIYRTIPSDDTIVNSILPYLPKKTIGKVFYIYTKGELATEDALIILESQQDLNIIPYAVDPEILLTVDALQTFFDNNGASDSDVTVLYIFDEQPYFDLYSNGLKFPGKQYDIINTNLPSINGITAQEELNDKLFYIQNIYPNTALLWRENADYLTAKSGGNTYITSTGVCNSLNMIDYFLKGKNIGLLGSFSAVLEFNEFKDIQFPSFLFRLYKKLPINNFVKNSISFDDPLLGYFQANFV